VEGYPVTERDDSVGAPESDQEHQPPDFEAFVAAALAGSPARTRRRRRARLVVAVAAAVVLVCGALAGVAVWLHGSGASVVAQSTGTTEPVRPFVPPAGWVARPAATGVFELWTSPAWSVWDHTDAALALRDQADFQYVKVFAEPRSDFDNLDSYLASVRSAHEDGTDRRILADTAPADLVVDGKPARQWQVTEQYHGLTHVVWYTVVQGDQGYYQILAYTRRSAAAANQDGLTRITRSFHEIPGRPLPVPTAVASQPPRSFAAADGQTQLTAPQDWTPIPAGRMDQGAAVGIEDGIAQVMLFVRKPGAPDLATAVRDVQRDVNQDPNFTIARTSAQSVCTLAGLPGTQWHTTGSFRGHNLTTWYAMAAGPDRYYEVMAWAPASHADAERAVVESVISSLRVS
jgi:hypothetical protein